MSTTRILSFILASTLLAACGDGADDPTHSGDILPDAPIGEWQAINMGTCRDGSQAQFSYRYGTESDLIIFLEGGGACYNSVTCAFNPRSVTPRSANDLNRGLGDKDDSRNPFKDWNMIFVSYCTGDVFAGVNADNSYPGINGVHQYVGYTNMAEYLPSWVATFTDANKVLLAGSSAGGFGALYNYPQVQEAFGNDVDVVLVDDSGPPLSDSYMAPCLQQRWRDVWGLNASLPADCQDCTQGNGGGLINYMTYLQQTYPTRSMALVSSLRDETTRTFYSYGEDNCARLDQTFSSYDAAKFEAGLADLRDTFLTGPNWSTYYVGGNSHTWLAGSSLFTTTVDNTLLIDWVWDVVNGTPAHVAP